MHTVLLSLFILCVYSLDFKNLAGPPKDFAYHRIQDPSKVLHLERSLAKSIWFNRQADNVTVEQGDLVYTTKIPVDGNNEVALSFASPVAEHLVVQLKDPHDQIVLMRTKKDFFHVGDSAESRIPAVVYSLENPIAGFYTFSLFSKSLTPELLKQVRDNPYPDASLMLVANDGIKIASHLQSYLIRAGSKVGIASTILDDGIPFKQTSNRNVVVSAAELEITNPTGQTFIVPMNDDGLRGDATPGDGKYSGLVQVPLSGTYVVEAKIDGRFVDTTTLTETPFQRSVQHLIEVSGISDLELSGKGRITILDQNRLALKLGVVGDKDVPKDYQFRAYAEVYGWTPQKHLKPACWIGGLITLDENHEFELVLDKRWLQVAGDLTAPLVLRNVYIADVSTSFPIVKSEKDIVIDGSANLPLYFRVGRIDRLTPEIEKEMRNGLKPAWLKARNLTRSAADIDLVLLPGYCAAVNPWTRRAQDFTNGFFPVQYGNYANDEYAKLIVQQIEAKKLTKFGIIAHSQGGMVALHIHNFYWTGLEEGEGERLIQTLGTPYQGTSASGSLANLAKVFGVACGSNADLSRDGATNWLSGISMDSRKDVYSYSSTYSSGSYFGDYCSIPMNLILQWPNDGVTEEAFASLPGGNWLGNTEKWCHTVDMGYPAQYDDESRNKILNSLAAR